MVPNEVVNDTTDPGGTLRPNLKPEPTFGTKFCPMSCPEFDAKIELPDGAAPSSPIAIFDLFFTAQQMKHIVKCTNQHGPYHAIGPRNSQSLIWKDTTVEELYAYLGILVYMALHPENDIHHYWSSDTGRMPSHLPVHEAMSRNRWVQLSHGFHLAELSLNAPKTDFERVEPLSSHLQAQFRKYWVPGRDLSIDEATVRFTGRSKHIVTIPSKPIPTGYKVWVTAQSGYILEWLWHSKGSGPVGVKVPRELGQNKTAATVPHLLKLLPQRPPESPYMVWLDNLFSSTKLLHHLRDLGFAATGTARANSGICKKLAQKKKDDAKKDLIPWGTLESSPTMSNQIQQFAWKDNAVVLFLSTAIGSTDGASEEHVIRTRKRPKSTSSSAKTARKPFGADPVKDLPIPKVVNEYNHHMGYVDQANHLRSTNPGLRSVKHGGWHALWNFLFHITIINSYLLSDYSDAYKFKVDLQGQLLARGERIPVQRQKSALFTVPDEGKKDHQLASGRPLRYCTVCIGPPDQKRKRSILGNISANSASTPSQKRRKTTYGCLKCGLAICKDQDCFEKHCTL